MKAYVYQGMGPPYVVRATIAATPELAPPTVTTVTLNATKPSGASVSWSASIVSATTDLLTVQYALASGGGDLDEIGEWKLWAACTVPGGIAESDEGRFIVRARKEGA